MVISISTKTAFNTAQPHSHARSQTTNFTPAVHYQPGDCCFVSLNKLKYASCQALCLVEKPGKVRNRPGRQRSRRHPSLGERCNFLLIACKGRQQNLKNDCPHTEISQPYRRQHLEDTHHSCGNLIVLNAFL